MSLRNYYTGKRITGDLLIDLTGNNDGEINGSPSYKPKAFSNGFINFPSGCSGSIGSTDYGRIDLEVDDFRYDFQDEWSLTIMYRHSGAECWRSLFACNYGYSSGYIKVYVNSDQYKYLIVNGGQTLSVQVDNPDTSGKWEIIQIVYNNSEFHIYNNDILKKDDSSSQSGNFYSPDSKPAVGAQIKDSSQYNYTFEGDIALFINRNHAMSPAEARNEYACLRGFF